MYLWAVIDIIQTKSAVVVGAINEFEVTKVIRF